VRNVEFAGEGMGVASGEPGEPEPSPAR
jgi:hypothetical protein